MDCNALLKCHSYLTHLIHTEQITPTYIVLTCLGVSIDDYTHPTLHLRYNRCILTHYSTFDDDTYPHQDTIPTLTP